MVPLAVTALIAQVFDFVILSKRQIHQYQQTVQQIRRENGTRPALSSWARGFRPLGGVVGFDLLYKDRAVDARRVHTGLRLVHLKWRSRSAVAVSGEWPI